MDLRLHFRSDQIFDGPKTKNKSVVPHSESQHKFPNVLTQSQNNFLMIHDKSEPQDSCSSVDFQTTSQCFSIVFLRVFNIIMFL